MPLDHSAPRRQEPALDRLAEAARADIAALAYPDKVWVKPVSGPDGTVAADVLIVGGGQSGLVIAAALRREGIANVVVLDQAPAGAEGPWVTFARMPELRTPKITVGMDFGIPNLGVRRWFETRYGADAWTSLVRLPRTDWMDYLNWYRAVWAIDVENGTVVSDIADAVGLLQVTSSQDGVERTRYAKLVVLATGSDGAGAWRVPQFISAALPRDRYDHSNQPIDFTRLKGKAIGILGHGASAFDTAVAALEAGVASVDLCFRRARLPRVNPHRYIENAGIMTHHPLLDDAVRWRIARHFRINDQPPAWASFERAIVMPGFRLHAAAPWLEVGMEDERIRVTTPRGVLTFDHVIPATGQVIDLAARPELKSMHSLVARWQDRFTPPPGEADAGLAQLPYLGDGYEMLPRDPDGPGWVTRVHAFNALSTVSQGPHSTSISGHRHALPRLVRGVTRRLLLDQQHELIAGLEAYADQDLPLPDDFEAALALNDGRHL
ncbi:NAD(P)/FAD-dependent oxidoreductase [Mesorhizobium sp. BR1-1-16]|uniref:NAD(P)-binding domain-containing protein n=1 Tax=Mesorhizobium sp. BR1-1-16 TaxID=2876653 RepID=UPI001CCF5561|nr:NAD(P)/FAD-dependent oxidoreductase [Mesorhizobium sp. BR1-1-16]MBZ9936239.1 NAD(P)/FAD-dependent oxidoreductase [Mesorhizobium sp. BR1-1-16]